MTSFNFTRFLHTLRWQIVSSRKNVLSTIAFGFIFALLPAVLFLLKVGYVAASPVYVVDVVPVFLIVAAFYFITCGAFIVSNVSDKLKRIDNFILPASKLEKFVSRYVYLLIVVPVAVFAGLVVGDLLQMLIYQIAVGDSTSLTLAIFKHLSPNMIRIGDIESIWVTFFCLWFIHAELLLFGTFFRRHAWIKSVLLALIIGIVLCLTIFFGVKEILDLMYGEYNYNIIIIETWWAHTLECLWSIALIIFCYWASYRIYAHMQAINNKWHNF